MGASDWLLVVESDVVMIRVFSSSLSSL